MPFGFSGSINQTFTNLTGIFWTPYWKAVYIYIYIYILANGRAYDATGIPIIKYLLLYDTKPPSLLWLRLWSESNNISTFRKQIILKKKSNLLLLKFPMRPGLSLTNHCITKYAIKQFLTIINL